MLPNRISASLSQDDRDAVMEAIKTIKERLPFLVTLSTEQIKELPKAGAKARDFSQKALEIVTQNPDIMPRSFDIEEMRKDVELHQAFEPVYLAFVQLMDAIESTHTLIRSESYSSALMVYTQAKTLGKDLGLGTSADLLGQLFARKVKPGPEPQTTK